ncbi:MAG: hypothetical protein N3A02_04885, partial [Rectinema sp.]|nr:hypothetical protein [Rectinema sp.]
MPSNMLALDLHPVRHLCAMLDAGEVWIGAPQIVEDLDAQALAGERARRLACTWASKQAAVTVEGDHWHIVKTVDAAAISIVASFDALDALGIGVVLRVPTVEEVAYIACGVRTKQGFWHLKARARPHAWLYLPVAFDADADYHLRACGSDLPKLPVPLTIKQVEVFFKLRSPQAALVADVQALLVVSQVDKVGRGAWQAWTQLSPAHSCALRKALTEYYLGKINQQSISLVDARRDQPLLNEETVPLIDATCLWPLDHPWPAAVLHNKTLLFSWHALLWLVPRVLLLADHHPGHVSFHALSTHVCYVVDHVSRYLQEWIAPAMPPKDRYVWYDHGVAERQLALIFMLVTLRDYGVHDRWMYRVLEAVCCQAKLLMSDVFYARNQSTPWPNHAWFQDLALLATYRLLPGLPLGLSARAIAEQRLMQQFDHLVISDGPFHIFVENSIAYHLGVSRILVLCRQLATSETFDAALQRIVSGMQAFANAFRFPNGRCSAQGDTSVSYTHL